MPHTACCCSALAANVNLDVWNDLTPQQQHILRYASMATTHTQLAETLANNGAALERLKAQGVKVLQFPDDVWDAFGTASAKVKDENMGDDLYKRIRESFEASMFSSSSWIDQSDGYYVQQRNRVLGG